MIGTKRASIYAISDLHLANAVNRKALQELPSYIDDCLLLAGDIGETEELIDEALTVLKTKFKQIFWAPGNHDLWSLPTSNDKQGVEKYNSLVHLCHKYNVLTPEDEYVKVSLQGEDYYIVPSFTLYDYTFCPKGINQQDALDWAIKTGIVCADEELLFSTPYRSIIEWCEARCNYTEFRLMQLDRAVPIIMIYHYPLNQQLAKSPLYPRFSIWCGTVRTEAWLKRFNIKVVVYGHMHIRDTYIYESIKFEEVSLGYPRDWNLNNGLASYLREIKP